MNYDTIPSLPRLFLDQAQKLFRLDRGDCCLAFCGDAQVAYPLFIQVGTTLNNFIKTRTRAEDITHLSGLVGQVLNNLIGGWDLPEMEKALAGNFSPDAVKSIKVASGNLNSDMHGSAEYRANLVSVMAARAVASAS